MIMNILRTRRRLRHRASFAALILLLLCAGPYAQGRSLLWKVTAKQGGTIYLAGSVHLLSDKYYPLKPGYDAAFARSDLLVEEVDMAEMIAPESQMAMLTRGMLPAGQSLEKLISAETLKELDTTRDELTKLADAWQAGDAPQVEKLALEDLRSEPAMYQRLLVERNQLWFPKIEALFSRSTPAFVVVGAAHLIGPDG